MPSWLRAMGRTYRMDTKAMVHLLGLPVRCQNYRTIHNAAHHFASQVARLSGCRVKDIERMAAAWQLPALQRFSAETSQTIVTDLDGSSYCPLCLRKYDGRWSADWLNPLYTYCPEHGVRLEKLCPHCQCRPFHGTDWLWANGNGWKCCKSNARTPDDDAAKTRLCGFDLRRAEPTADATRERLFAQAHLKQVLDAVVMMATEIMTWTQMIGFKETKARRWEPKKLRARLFEIGGKLAKHARQTTLHLASTAPEVQLLLKGMKRVAALSPP